MAWLKKTDRGSIDSCDKAADIHIGHTRRSGGYDEVGRYELWVCACGQDEQVDHPDL